MGRAVSGDGKFQAVITAVGGRTHWNRGGLKGRLRAHVSHLWDGRDWDRDTKTAGLVPNPWQRGTVWAVNKPVTGGAWAGKAEWLECHSRAFQADMDPEHKKHSFSSCLRPMGYDSLQAVLLA